MKVAVVGVPHRRIQPVIEPTRYTYTIIENEYAIQDNGETIKTYPRPKKLKAQKGMVNNIENEVRDLNASVGDRYLTERERQRLNGVINHGKRFVKESL